MLLIVVLAGFGAGVAINALADSLPRSRTLAPPSCGACGAARPSLAWSGLLAFVAGKTYCGYCGTPIGLRQPVVESLAAAWSAVLFLINPAPGVFWPAFLLSMIFLLVIVIDFEHRLILHVVTGPAALAMALIGSLDPTRGPVKTLVGGVVGFAAVFGLYLLGGLFARLMARVRGQPLEEVAFGFGDVT
ncbi:MAG: prepilin peptidase, partial [Chloroflexota bacterium]